MFGSWLIAVLVVAVTGARAPIVGTATGDSTPAPILLASLPASAQPAPAAATTERPANDGAISELLATLRVAPEVLGGYDRDLFVQWTDDDGDGCNTRREVLIAEAVVGPTVGSNCELIGGTWVSVYDGLTITSIADLDIDHVVALAEAWRSGAFGWTGERRMRFANDLGLPSSLAAVSAGSDRAKADKDPAEWLPPLDSFACTYVAWWIEVKVRWSLTIDSAERDELQDIAARCRDTPASTVVAP